MIDQIPDDILIKSSLILYIGKTVVDLVVNKFSRLAKSVDGLTTEVKDLKKEVRHLSDSVAVVPVMREELVKHDERLQDLEVSRGTFPG